jgi:hypothetical protein
MTGRSYNFMFLMRSSAGCVFTFNLPDRSAAWHRAE